MLNYLLILIVFLISTGLLIGLIFLGTMSRVTGVKIMLIGINITIFCSILINLKLNLGGIELYVVLLGLVISLIGLFKKD